MCLFHLHGKTIEPITVKFCIHVTILIFISTVGRRPCIALGIICVEVIMEVWPYIVAKFSNSDIYLKSPLTIPTG